MPKPSSYLALSSSLVPRPIQWPLSASQQPDVVVLKARSQHQDIVRQKCIHGEAIFSVSSRKRVQTAQVKGRAVSLYQVSKWLKVKSRSYFYDQGKGTCYEFMVGLLTNHKMSYGRSILRTMGAVDDNV